MSENHFIKIMKRAKITQLCIMSAVDIIFVIILLTNPSFSKRIFDDYELFIVCAVTWIVITISLFYLLHDFLFLRSFAKESHALNQIAYIDSLTGIPNRHGLDTLFRTYDSAESMTDIGCYMATITNLKEINDTLGRSTGDKIIKDFCHMLEEIGDHFGIVGRNGGNDFLAVIDNCSENTITEFTKQLNQKILDYNNGQSSYKIQLSSTYVLNKEAHIRAFPEILIVTYNKLHSTI